MASLLAARLGNTLWCAPFIFDFHVCVVVDDNVKFAQYVSSD